MGYQYFGLFLRKLFYLLLSSILLLSASSWATEPRVTPGIFVDDLMQVYAVDFPPFVSNDVEGGGLCAEIVNSVFKQKNLNIPHNILPVMSMVKYYLFDENALASHTNYFHLTKKEKANLILVPIAVATKKIYYAKSAHQDGLPWTGQLTSLEGYTYGAYRDEPVNEYEQAGINVHSGSARSLLKRLESKAADFIKMPELAVNWMLYNIHGELKDDVVAVENSETMIPLYIVFNAEHPNGKSIAEKFKVGLSENIKRGKYQAILSKYIPAAEDQQIYMDQLNVYRANF